MISKNSYFSFHEKNRRHSSTWLRGQNAFIKAIKYGFIDNSLEAGEPTLEEDTQGGIGRHLELFSSTLLIQV